MPEPYHRSGAQIGIEPMRRLPHAFRTGAAVIGMEPGDSFSGNWGVTPH
jgi:aldose 1-epimerase